ncbi:MAG: hypothetical protein FWB88_03520 [Defluviitaleaceae bacterium]|nr:hypothetical protein [Defluviitaleaceae bacterium]MCL2238731.1 hypothetical protein [Defluviitaleaceae bacterium]
MKKCICIALALVLALAPALSFTAFASGTGPTNYTYTYNEWGVPVPSPDAYRVTAFIMGADLYLEGESVGHFFRPQDLAVYSNYVFVADTGNSRIVVIRANEDGTHEAVDVAYHAYYPDGTPTTFNRPYGVFVSSWPATRGEIWIADTYNQRILHVDRSWNILNEVLKPTDLTLLEEEMEFLPQKIVVDFSGRIFAQVMRVNRGLMEFSFDGEFVGYMGAPPVVVNIVEQFWRLVSTRAQRDRRILFVPVEYNNVHIDREGFLLVTTSSEEVDPVRRLNILGEDVMIRNGWWYPVGDLWFGDAAHIRGPSTFVAVTSLPNNSFVVFDSTRGRLFSYCSQGHLLYAWGGPGFREGFFQTPVALDSMGYTLFALDAATMAITRFDLTEYGELINLGLHYYHRGMYDESAAAWQEVLRLNGNFGMAYIGIARAYLRLGYYRQAMRYFRIQRDALNYGRAFSFYRREWVERNFWIFALAVGVLIVVPPVVKKAIAIRKELKEA